MRLTNASLQAAIDAINWSNLNKGITGDIVRQLIQHLKDSPAEGLLLDGKTIQYAITQLQMGIGEGTGDGGATNDMQLSLSASHPALDIEAGQMQSQFNAAVNAIIASLVLNPVFSPEEKAKLAAINEHYRGTYISLEALTVAIPTGNAGDEAVIDAGGGTDAKKALWDSTDNKWVLGIALEIPTETETDISQLLDYDPALAYTAGETYRVYVNLESADESFRTKSIYQAMADAAVGQSPETHPFDPETGTGIWWRIGNTVSVASYVTSRGSVSSLTELMNIANPRHGDTCGIYIDTFGTLEVVLFFDATSSVAHSLYSCIKPASILTTEPGRWLFKFVRRLYSVAKGYSLQLTSTTAYIGEGHCYFNALNGRTSILFKMTNNPLLANYVVSQAVIYIDNSVNTSAMAFTLDFTEMPGDVAWLGGVEVTSIAAGKRAKMVIDSFKNGATALKHYVKYEVVGEGGSATITLDAVPTAGSTNAVQSGGVKAELDKKQDSKVIEQMFKVNSTTDVGEFSCDVPFKINAITPQSGLIVTCKTSAGVVYTLGATVAAFDFLTFQGDVTGKIFLVRGEKV